MRIGSRGAFVIPASFRKALGIRPGDTLFVRVDKGELRITTLRQYLAKAQQIVRKHVSRSVSLVAELITERREEARRD